MREQVLRVGQWLARPGLNELSLGARTVHLEPRVMPLLACLAEQPGRVVSKSEILDRVWPETFVTEAVLWQCVWKLRQIFEDDRRSPRYIQTIPRVGYRLAAPLNGLKRRCRTVPNVSGVLWRSYA